VSPDTVIGRDPSLLPWSTFIYRNARVFLFVSALAVARVINRMISVTYTLGDKVRLDMYILRGGGRNIGQVRLIILFSGPVHPLFPSQSGSCLVREPVSQLWLSTATPCLYKKYL